ncbi:MAG: arabinan endo,5-alpha-L-arabinosidase [Pseudonocardiales bacterium]|jgi:beta-xylosidase|nr:arabinan endo,5-alpha-L-arabinosidase [Pseudonocardiales bacterium]MDT7587765.1 arabinan endo,5-alpha-L-arabinosidase [Pseudonocardiales bacterium]
MSRFPYSTLVPLLTASLAVIPVAALVAATAVSTIKPVIERDFPDPAVLAVDDNYFAYSTASGYGHQFWHVPVQRASDLSGDWTVVGDALPVLPPWSARDSHGNANVTAPEVAPRKGGGYILYFVAQGGPKNVQCVGAALASSPTGPFQPTPSPLVCQPGYVDSIDPQAFTDSDGKRYLLYASGQTRTTIWLQQVTPDGLGLVGDRRALIQADRPDEANIVEAPSLVKHGSEYVLFYSGDTFNSGGYFVNYAISPALAGPFKKHDGQLVNRDSMGGSYPNPGGECVVVGKKHDALVFHASAGPHRRAMFVAGLSWSPLGRPTVDLDNGLTSRYSDLAAGRPD